MNGVENPRRRSETHAFMREDHASSLDAAVCREEKPPYRHQKPMYRHCVYLARTLLLLTSSSGIRIALQVIVVVFERDLRIAQATVSGS